MFSFSDAALATINPALGNVFTKFDELEFFANQVFFLCEERGLEFNLLAETLTYNFFKVGASIASNGFCLDNDALLKNSAKRLILGATAYERVKLEFNFQGQLTELSELELAVLDKFFNATLQTVDAILRTQNL